MANKKPIKKDEALGRPATTPDAREKQLIALAVDCAEQQLRSGTASPSVITHYLKLGSAQAELEVEKLKHENELLKAKTEAIQAAKQSDIVYKEAIEYFRIYNGENREGE